MVARAHVHVFRASVHEQLQNFWTLDHLGITNDEMLERDLELEVKNTIECDGSGKYAVSWPWKPQAWKNLALNKAISETRLRRMVRRMTPEEYTVYDNQLKILLEEDHIELLPNDCIPQSYLPHQGIVKMDRETTKLRIVHDASAKPEGGLSLNDALEEDRNVCCFLWLNPQGEIDMYRYRKVFFGAKSSPFLLQVVLKQH